MNSSNKHLGYEYWSELYLTQDKFNKNDWQKILNTFSRYKGFLSTFKLIVSIDQNTISYYLGTNIDVRFLSNNLDGIIIKPITDNDVTLPKNTNIESFINYVNNGNIIDILEKYQIKRNKTLEYAVFTIRIFNFELAHTKAELYFTNLKGIQSVSCKNLFSLPISLLSINFLDNKKYLRKKYPKYLDIQKTLNIMRSEPLRAIFEVETFPYLPNNYCLPIESYDFDNHSLIVGASGTGKSKLISLMIDRLSATNGILNNHRVIVIDPHATIESDLTHINNSQVINFKNHNESVELFSSSNKIDVSAATELTGTLFKSLLADQFNPNVERVLRFSLFVLMTAQIMSLDKLKQFLTDIEYRNKILDHVADFIPNNILKFFNTDFNELRVQNYTEAILPLISLVDEMQLQPSLVEQNNDTNSLVTTINNNFLTIFSLNKISMGEKVVKTVSGLIMQQIFLLAQARNFNEKIILFIDEVSIVQNPAMSAMLAEARKYNLFVFLTQQYLGQIEKDLQDAIFTNIINYYIFRVSEEDAKALEGNLVIEIPKEILLSESVKGINEDQIKIRMLTSLNMRECILRLSGKGQILPCIKARTLNAIKIKNTNPKIALKAYKKPTALPTKFTEHTNEKPNYANNTHGDLYSGYNAAKNLLADIAISTHSEKPTVLPTSMLNPKTPVNLAELLTNTSSKRNDTNKK